ncbi:hypothetical protein ABIC22_005775 [Paenibacillus sp. PvP094]|uniref:Uncharacterized protein n=1 Tax=Paenibacillus illinoisensis TaxID=59845 RepID=A0A2W0C6G6_9BACL|nr:hypothetical protein PIL02S_03116 [Paenibacillus illinoisensis]
MYRKNKHELYKQQWIHGASVFFTNKKVQICYNVRKVMMKGRRNVYEPGYGAKLSIGKH